MITVEHLTKKYGDRVAVRDVSFELGDKRIIGFLGPNGAGKSTTMNMITGYLAPDSGSVTVNEISMMKQPQKAKAHIGYLAEQPPIYLDMTMAEYLNFVAELRGVPKSERKNEVKRVMELTKTFAVEDRLLRNLSKGYRQRAGIAQALLGDPEILILDEPTVGLDPKQIVEIRGLIKMLGKDHTVILSTHILSEVAAVCDEIIVISRGQVVAQDTPEHLVAAYNQNKEITIVAKANATRVEAALKELSFVQEMWLVAEEAQTCKVRIHLVEQGLTHGGRRKHAPDEREILMEHFAQKGIRLLELSRKEASLEDVYLQLTSDTYMDTVPDEDEEYDDEEDLVDEAEDLVDDEGALVDEAEDLVDDEGELVDDEENLVDVVEEES